MYNVSVYIYVTCTCGDARIAAKIMGRVVQYKMYEMGVLAKILPFLHERDEVMSEALTAPN